MATKKGSEVQNSEDLIQEVNVDELVNAEDPVKEVIDLSLGRRAGAGQRHKRVSQQFVSAPVESPLGAGRSSGRYDEIWG